MSYVISPNVRTIGGREECYWSDVNIDGYVTLDGYFANYAGVVGGEKVDIRVGSSNSSIITITLNPGDTTNTAVVNRINSFIPNLASIPNFSGNQSIRLRHHSYLEVTNIYDRTIDFARIGLPLAIRDGYSLNNYKLIDGTATNQIGGGGSFVDRFDNLSLPIYIDPGSNCLTFWTSIDNIDTQCFCGINIIVFWSNGFEGELDSTLLAIPQLPSQVFTSPVQNGHDSIIMYTNLLKQVFIFNSLPIPKVYFDPITLNVPRGASKFRIGISPGNTSNDGLGAFIELPKITAAVYQGAQ